MTKIGPYQVVDVVSLTPTGAVSTVRLPRRSGVLFALKQLKSVHTDPDEPQWDSQLFLDRARVQKSRRRGGGQILVAECRDMGGDGRWRLGRHRLLPALGAEADRIPFATWPGGTASM